ncbi:MAG: hypothetical protein K2L97_06660 [Muribaculaceae bacterium]|nr:hypothetical protein [Muribaculaceae bacterium]
MQIFHSVEFYVIIFLVAALIVGLMAMPASHGPVETDFATGRLTFDPDLSDITPRIELEALPDGTVRIIRYGLPDRLDNAATVALAINRKGFDLTIEERITPTDKALLSSECHPVNKAEFILTGLAHERYHLKYNSDTTSSFTALTFNNRPGLRSTRLFRQA